MKYALLAAALLTASSSCFAQNNSSKQDLFNFDNSGDPKVVRTLGSDPEFTCLQNKKTKAEVLAAMKKIDEKGGKEKREMNKMLKGIGFDNGIKDVRLANIKAATLSSGTTGNMGDGSYHNIYSELKGNPNGYKAWKITADNGQSMYFMSRCGNAFAVNNGSGANSTACVQMPVNVTSEPKVITSETPMAKRVDEKKVYIYYHRKGYTNLDNRLARRDVPDDNPSRPLLLRSVKKAHYIPQEYTVTVTSQDDKVKVCHNQTVEVPASINVEYNSEYTGNYPNKTNKVYKEVSKRVYKKSLRKMRKADRKEEKIMEMTDVRVNR